MSPSSGPRDEPMIEDEFDAELDRLVAEARDEGVPIEGAQNVRSPRPDDPDYTIEITEITKRTPEWGAKRYRE